MSGRADARISYLFGAFGVATRKAPAFLQRLLSLVRYGAEDEVRTRYPFFGNSIISAPDRTKYTIRSVQFIVVTVRSSGILFRYVCANILRLLIKLNKDTNPIPIAIPSDDDLPPSPNVQLTAGT